MPELFPRYPRLFQESDIVCRHPFNSPWGLPPVKPELCRICRAFLTAQQKLYGELAAKPEVGIT